MGRFTGVLKPIHGIYLMGLTIVVLAVGQVAISSAPTTVLVIEAVFPLSMAGAVFYGGYYLTRTERSRVRAKRVLASAILIVSTGMVVVGVDFLVNTLLNQTNSNVSFTVVSVLAVGSALGIPVGFYYDEAITKRSELERELGHARSLNEQLDTVNQRLLVMNRVVRHNLRTELTLLSGYYEGFRDSISGSDAEDRLEHCRECIDNLTEIERKTTYIERLGTTDVDGNELGSRDVTAVVERVVDSCRSRTPTATVDVDAVPEAHVPDHPLLPTILTELVTNATQHNDAETLDVEVLVSTPATDAVEVVVADDGSGIPDQELDALERGDETPLVHASGIGLWLVKWVVAEMDGTLTFEENSPSGTRVVMRFPRRPGTDDRGPGTGAQSSSGAASSGAAPSTSEGSS